MEGVLKVKATGLWNLYRVHSNCPHCHKSSTALFNADERDLKDEELVFCTHCTEFYIVELKDILEETGC